MEQWNNNNHRTKQFNQLTCTMGQWANGTTIIIGIVHTSTRYNNSIGRHVQWDKQKIIRTTKSSGEQNHRTTIIIGQEPWRTTIMKEKQPPSSDNNHNRGHSPPCPATPRFLAKRNWCWRWNATRTFPDHRPSVAVPVWCGHGCFATTPTVAWRTKRTTHWIDGGYEWPCCLAPPFKQRR